MQNILTASQSSQKSHPSIGRDYIFFIFVTIATFFFYWFDQKKKDNILCNEREEDNLMSLKLKLYE